jgi:hypothetical protein
MPDANSVFLSSWLQFARFLFGALFLLPSLLRRNAISRLELI